MKKVWRRNCSFWSRGFW